MTGLNLFHSNRQEILAKKLVETFTNAPLPPLQPEIIIVQSLGMERWLALHIAGIQKIWAHYRCPFPNSFVQEIFCALNLNPALRSSYDRESMTWTIMDLIAEKKNNPAFTIINSYLDSDHELKRYQLAERIAYLFDQYTIYRPELIHAWENDLDPHLSTHQAWQKELWLDLRLRFGPHHRSNLLHAFLETMNTNFDPAVLPSRISIIGVSSLPHYHLQVFNALAAHCEINIFLLNPCREFWDDIYSDREISRLTEQGKTPPEALFLERGNTLLSSMGHVGRDFLSLLHNYNANENYFFHEPDPVNILTTIQNDILRLQDRDATARQDDQGARLEKIIVSADDESIRIHSCHSPMREIEVLRNQLLHLFENDKELRLDDVLIMAPDIDEYAAFIQVVFNSSDKNTSIPFCIADRDLRKTNRIIETFFALLDLADSRFTSLELLAILEEPAVQNRFALDKSDLQTITQWVEATRIYWGIDEQTKSRHGLPPSAENTWRAGLNRLLLGYAMSAKGTRLFSKILPYDVEGNEAETLGRFLDFCETVFRTADSLYSPHTLAEWSVLLNQLVEDFFANDDALSLSLDMLRSTILDLAELQERSGYNGSIGITVVCSYLQQALNKEESLSGFKSSGFLSGGVTCCSMLPMRAIPFKIICLLGMNGNSYPRASQKISFDLMMESPKRGDRSRRYDDRYLFLETILSARQHLSISYVGRSIWDDTDKPPSVLVSELMDYISAGFMTASGTDIRNHILTVHRLQAFSPDYFTGKDNKLFSFDRQGRLAAEALTMSEQAPRPFLAKPLAAISAELQVTIDQLCAFYSHPIKHFTNHRLGIYYEKEHKPLAEQETFSLKGLDRYLLATEIFEQKLAGQDLQILHDAKKVSGALPHGRLGDYAWEKTVSEVEEISRSLQHLTDSPGLNDYDIRHKTSGCLLTGVLTGIREIGLCRFRATSIKPKDKIRSWIYHLLWNLAGDAAKVEINRQSILAGTAIYVFKPIVDADLRLEKLLEFYRDGLSRPLSFYPQTSLIYAEKIRKKNKEDALKDAGQAWIGNNFSRGEHDDPYYSLCLRGRDPFADDFTVLAEEIYGPMLACMEIMKT